MKHNYLPLLILVSFFGFSCKKEIVKTSQTSSSLKYASNGNRDYVKNTKKTSGGGFICCGISGNGATGYDGFLLKLDAEGNTEWYRNYGGGNYDELTGVIECSDGSFVAVGRTNSKGQGFNSGTLNPKDWVVKTDKNGNILWDHSYIKSATGPSLLNAVVESKDEYYYATGSSHDTGTYMDVVVLKISKNGTLADMALYNRFEHYKPYSLSKGAGWVEEGNSIIMADNGSVVIGGIMSASAGGTGIVSYLTTLISVDTNNLDSVHFYQPYESYIRNFVFAYEAQTNPKTYLVKSVTGYYIASPFELQGDQVMTVQLIKTDFNGNLIWEKKYKGSGNCVPDGMTLMPDESLIITGGSSVEKYNITFPGFYSSMKAMLLAVDKDGNILSSHFSGAEDLVTHLMNFQKLPDETLLGIGYETMQRDGFDKIFTIKMSLKGEWILN